MELSHCRLHGAAMGQQIHNHSEMTEKTNAIKDYLWRKKMYLMGRFFPKKLAEYKYRSCFGKSLNWDNPQTIDEKINWAKFNTDTTAWSQLADKYAVRKFVEQRGFKDALVTLYGKWERVEDIDWDSLPDSFVMKMNNGSGDVMICRDKSTFDIAGCKRHFAALMKKKFGYEMSEPHYNRIKPCVIAEELLDSTAQSLPSTSMIDYKFFAFDGKPAYVLVCLNRSGHSVELAVYDMDWHLHPEFSVPTSDCIIHTEPMPQPKAFGRMADMAAKLSEGFPFVRVDLYETGGKPYFGEMTFTPAGGFLHRYTEEFRRILGDKYKLK